MGQKKVLAVRAVRCERNSVEERPAQQQRRGIRRRADTSPQAGPSSKS